MKRNVLVFGLISGAIVTIFMLIGTYMCYNNENYTPSEILGYTAMLVSFSFVFVGIKNYRDKYNGGIISFGKAFQIGFYIALIASSMYVIAWLINYYAFQPDFMEKYSAHVIKHAKESGVTQIELDKQIKQMEYYKGMYKNPLFVILLTYMEILPLGVLVSLISSLILKRKSNPELPQYPDIE